MSAATNKLVVNAKRMALPTTLAGALAIGGAFFVSHGRVYASSAAPSPSAALSASTAPIDSNSVAALTSLDKAMEAITTRVTPSIVNVAVTSRATAQDTGDEGDGQEQGQNQQLPQGLPPGFEQFFGGGMGPGQPPMRPQIEHGVGSGVIISPDGYIVTNNHVVKGATDIKVTLDDRRVFNARVIGVDKMTDLAVIKINATNLTPIAWGDSTTLRPGETVLAFGSPFGSLRFSVTRGIVSAVNRPNPFRTNARQPGEYIQTDAAINPGNSGGALVNVYGQLIGINTGIITDSGSFAGAGFAIPEQTVHSTVEQLMAHGKVDHGYLGISMNDVTPANASFFDLKDASGAIVAQVSPDSPASRSGIKQGDVIRQLNGHNIADSSALQVAVSEMSPGTKLTLGIERNGHPSTLNLTVGSYHAGTETASNGDQGQGSANTGKLGLAVANLSEDLRQQIQAPPSVQGPVVQSVRPGSPAEDAGLQPGDVILEVDRKAAQSAGQFVSEIHSAPAGKDILLLVWSRGNASYRTLRPDTSTQSGE